MPALDVCHEQVVRALQKDGWQIQNSPIRLQAKSRTAFIDIEAIRTLNGHQQHLLLVEVKCFPDPDSTTRDLYTGMGQYLIYYAIVEERGDNIPLYLAIPEPIYQTVFDDLVLRTLHKHGIKLLIVDLEKERIVQWNE